MRIHKLFGAHHLDSLQTACIRSGRISCSRWHEVYVVGADGIARERCIESELFPFSFLASSVLFSEHPTVHVYNYNNRPAHCDFCLFRLSSQPESSRPAFGYQHIPFYCHQTHLWSCVVWLESGEEMLILSEMSCGFVWSPRADIGESVNHKASNCW